MEFTQEVLEKMQDKLKYNKIFGNWYYGLSEELKPIALTKSKQVYNRGERIQNCLDYWLWDIYHKNKIMDLKKVNRCMNNRFCPNCKKFELAKFIHSYGKTFKELLIKNYNPYLLTLTVPNVSGEDLRQTIDNMNKSFNRFFKLFNQPIGQGKKGFKDRFMEFEGALKVLEITYNKQNNTFHPHFHCMIFSIDYPRCELHKNIQGAWSNKRQAYNMNSIMDIQVMKLWYMCYNNIRLSSKNYNALSDDWYDLYLCDIKEMDEHGIYEVLKYTFKDTDVSSYYVFKTLVNSLENKRIRQGYGILQGLKCEDIEEGEKQDLSEYLKEDEKESPDNLLTKGLTTLITEYTKYRKISRFNAYKELQNL